MIQTPDPFGQEYVDTPETLELLEHFTPEVIAQMQRDTFAVYGGWALHCWGFPFRLYAEQAERFQPLPRQDSGLDWGGVMRRALFAAALESEDH